MDEEQMSRDEAERAEEEARETRVRLRKIMAGGIALAILIMAPFIWRAYKSPSQAPDDALTTVAKPPAVTAVEAVTRSAVPVGPECEARLYDQATAERTQGQDLTAITTAKTGQEVGAAVVCRDVADGTVMEVVLVQPETGLVLPGSLTLQAIDTEHVAGQGAFVAGEDLPPGYWLFGFELDGVVLTVLELTIT